MLRHILPEHPRLDMLAGSALTRSNVTKAGAMRRLASVGCPHYAGAAITRPLCVHALLRKAASTEIVREVRHVPISSPAVVYDVACVWDKWWDASCTPMLGTHTHMCPACTPPHTGAEHSPRSLAVAPAAAARAWACGSRHGDCKLAASFTRLCPSRGGCTANARGTCRCHDAPTPAGTCCA